MYVYALDNKSGALRVFNKSTGNLYKSFFLQNAVKGISLVIATVNSQPTISSNMHYITYKNYCDVQENAFLLSDNHN